MTKTILRILMCSLGVLAFSVGAAFADFTIKGGIDVSGTHKVDPINMSDDVEMGYSISAEYLRPIMKFIQIGAGAEYQIPRAIENQTGKFGFIPVYGVVRVPIKLPMLTPFAVGRIGYSFFTGDDDYKGGASLKGGLHYGFGGGVIVFKFLLVEASYSVSSGTGEWMGGDFDIKYSKIGLQAGVNF